MSLRAVRLTTVYWVIDPRYCKHNIANLCVCCAQYNKCANYSAKKNYGSLEDYRIVLNLAIIENLLYHSSCFVPK